jgi:hypothetical protein
MTDRDDILDDLIDEAADAWTPDVPPGFADRVMAAKQRTPSPAPAPTLPERRPRWSLRQTTAPVLAAAAAALLVLVVERAPAFVPDDGEIRATDRTTVALDDRATAVAESGAELSWSRRAGALTVAQDKGSVFYRVDEGGPFVVDTPGGQVTVTGTCFTVEVFPMNTISSLPRSHFLSAAVGAVLSAAVVVTVYEGSVTLDSGGDQVALAAGERAAAAGQAPVRLSDLKSVADARDAAVRERDALAAENDELEAQLKSYMLAEANGTDPLVGENERLRGELATLKQELAVEQQLRGEQEGKAFEFPDDIPDSYRQEAMHSAVAAALTASGLSGDIHTVDCSEFPCMVQGETWAPGDTDATSAALDDGHRKMLAELHKQYPEEENSFSNSSWGDARQDKDGGLRRMRRFSVSVYPKDVVGKEERKDFQRRMRWRNDQLREAWPMQ